MSKKVIWITGGSSGIGAALVKKYSDSGYYVIATARSKGQLEKVASSSNYPENIKIFPADLEKVNELSKIIQSVWNIFDGIDLVILNAGVGQWGEVKDTEMNVERKIFELNFWSPVQSIKLLIPKMENKGSGTIICVGSIASQFGQAKLAAYSASKSAGDHLVRSYGNTYGLKYIITNCSNNYGPYQFPEKLIPHMILNALQGKNICFALWFQHSFLQLFFSYLMFFFARVQWRSGHDGPK